MVTNGKKDKKLGAEDIRSVLDQIVHMQKRLAFERKALGLTQKDVAHKLGWKQSEVSRFENSEVMPRMDTLMLYARCIGMEIDLSYSFDEETVLDALRCFELSQGYTDAETQGAWQGVPFGGVTCGWNNVKTKREVHYARG